MKSGGFGFVTHDQHVTVACGRVRQRGAVLDRSNFICGDFGVGNRRSLSDGGQQGDGDDGELHCDCGEECALEKGLIEMEEVMLIVE